MLKQVVKKIAYYTGLLDRFHRTKNENSLTVVLFHRVLDEQDERWAYADKEWSVDSRFFRQCLRFFKKHYQLVTLDDVKRSIDGSYQLPPTPLLISFDDGWADNLEYAQAILQEEGIRSALLFVTVNAIGKRILSWQETLYSYWLLSDKYNEDLTPLFKLAETENFPLQQEQAIRKLIALIQKQPLEIQNQALEFCQQLLEKLPDRALMLTPSELLELHQRGFELGTHGLNHEAMTQINNVYTQLTTAKNQLIDMVPGSNVFSMSYPLGRNNQSIINETVRAGYHAIFTGDECLNTLPHKAPALLGRLNINQLALCDGHGNLLPEALALHLFRRPSQQLRLPQ